MNIPAEVSKQWRWVLALGALLLLSGLAAISAPQFASYVLATLIGWLFLFASVSQLMSAAYLRRAQAVSPIVISGLLTLAAGIVLLVYPGLTVAMLTLLIGAFFLAEAIFKSVGAFDLKPSPVWRWVLADGIITGVLAILILGGWPSRSDAVIGLLVGISLVFSGASLLSTAFFLKSQLSS